MPREGRDADVGPERDASRLDDPARVESPALDRSPRPGDAPRRASTDAGERTGAWGRSSDAGSLASESSSASPTASAAIVELDGLVHCPAEAHAKRPFDANPNARDGTNAHPPSASESEQNPAYDSNNPRRSFGTPRLSRQKSWGSAKIARLDEEARADSLRETKRREAQRSLPLFSKLRYVLLCGEPLQADKMLSNRAHRMSAAAAAKTKRRPRRQNANENGPASASVFARRSFPFPFFSFAEAPFGNRPSRGMTVRSRTREEAPSYDTRALTNERERFEKHWWMIHPFSRFRRRWDVTVVFATAYVALLAPFVIGFDVDAPRGSALFFFDRVVDGAFFLDVLLNYFTGYVETNRGRVVLEPKAVAWTYTKTWAPLDALASVPFDLVFPDEETNTHTTEYAYGSHTESFAFSPSFPPPPDVTASLTGTSSRADAAYRGAKVVRVIKLVRLLKLFRVLRVTRALARLERGLSIRYGAWQIVKFACVVLTLAHWQACAWFLTHTTQKSTFYDSEEVVTTWVDVLAEAQGTAPETLDDASRFAKYAACVYWATTTMTTIGYGDIVPVTSVERVVVIVAQLIGSCVFLYGLTQVTALVADNDSGDVEFQRLMDDANKYFEKRSVPTSLRQKVREHLHHRRFFFASSSVSGGGGFEASSEEDSGAVEACDMSYGQITVASSSDAFGGIARQVRPKTRGGAGNRLDLFCADDDGERRVLSRLSLEVRREVRLWSMRDVLNQQPFFRDDKNETFVKLCTDSLKRRFFGPNEVIVGAGEIGRKLFFLSRGDAEVRTRRGRRVRALPEGAMFGEIALVLSMASDDERGPKEASERRRITQPPPRERSSARGGSRGDVRKKCKTIRRTADVRTSAFVETLVLSDAAYIRAAAAAPETAAEVERLARERFRSVNAARWRSATLAVIAANAILRNAGFPSVARGRAERGK